MQYPDIDISRDGHVAIVEIRRPPNNFFDAELISNLARAFEALDGDDDCRALVLCSAGKHFCAGNNFAASRNNTERRSNDARRHPLCACIICDTFSIST